MLTTVDLSDSPRRAAETLVVKSAVVCPARFLRWRVKSDVGDIGERVHGHSEGLNPTIEIFIIDGVFIVPYAIIWPRHLVADKENPVTTRIRLVLSYYGACVCPSHDGRLHSHGVTNVCK